MRVTSLVATPDTITIKHDHLRHLHLQKLRVGLLKHVQQVKDCREFYGEARIRDSIQCCREILGSII